MMKCLRAIVLMISCILLLAGCEKKTCRHSKERIVQSKIKAVFQDWMIGQIKAGNYWAKDSCNPEFIIKRNPDGRVDHAIGIPDDSKITYSIGDVNGDGIKDGLVTFFPKLCDCLDENKWTQYQILILSEGNKYSVKDTFFNSIGDDTRKGFYHLDSMDVGKIYGTYFEFHDGDNMCCPGIQQTVTISYPGRSLKF